MDEIFRKHNRENHHHFTMDEFKAIVRDILDKGGSPVPEEYLENMVKQVDLNKDGNIERKELCAFYKKLLKDQGQPASTH